MASTKPRTKSKTKSTQSPLKRQQTRTAAQPTAHNFSQPDELRTFANGRLELVQIAGTVVGRATLEPGWKWSESVKPLVNTRSCEAPHFQYQVSGVLKVRMDDGTELTCRAGDVVSLPTGHDAWVEGDQPVVVVDFQGMHDYAKSMPARAAARPKSRPKR